MEASLKIGKYEVVDVIGKGGMGVVYKAVDPNIGRFVAIKMITSGFAGNPELLERFYREAKSTGSLQSPNIVTVYELGDQDGNPYLVMEYLEGVSLESMISSGSRLTLLEKLGIMIDVCHGLAYAHRRGVIHRDIKPANIMVLTDGTAKIVDFGIARIGDSRMTQTDRVIGSVFYMSPEQFQAKPLDPRTDIFSTGVTLFQVLTGSLPFSANEAAAVMRKIVNEPPSPLNAFIRDYPAELDTIVSRALAKDREERYASANDFGFDLGRVQEQLKQDGVRQYVQRAEVAVTRGEWQKAKECLQQVLRLDPQNARAHRLLADVQTSIRKEQRSEQVRALRTHADEAFIEQHYEEALNYLDQALSFDESNLDLLSFRESVRSAQLRAEKLRMVLERAESAQTEGAVDDAMAAVSEALELDPANTQAKALHVILKKQLEEQSREKKLRSLLDEAQHLIKARKLTDAFQVLESAEAINPSSLDFQAVKRTAVALREQEIRKADISAIGQAIQDALALQDYEKAAQEANRGLQKYPNDQSLAKLKSLLENERGRFQRKKYAEDCFHAANGLFRDGKIVEALSTLDAALQKVPDDTQLESLRTIVRAQLTKGQSREHLDSALTEAKRAISSGDLRTAIQTLESALRKNPGDAEISRLLTLTREQLSAQAVSLQTTTKLRALVAAKQFDDAIVLLESQLQTASNARMQELLAEVRREKDQFIRGVRSAVEEGTRILSQFGANAATSFFQAQRSEFASTPEFKTLWSEIEDSRTVEALAKKLNQESDPELQVNIAEQSHREFPGSAGVTQLYQKAVDRRNQIQSIIYKARELELGRRYAEAAQQWSELKTLYPGHPQLQGEIARLSKLKEEQARLTEPAPGSRTGELSASLGDKYPGLHDAHVGVSRQPRHGAFLSKRRLGILLAASAILITLVAIFVVKGRFHQSTQPSERELALEKESNRLKQGRQFEEAMAVDRQLQDSGGVLSQWARDDAQRISQLLASEKVLMQEGKNAEAAQQWDLAIEKYQGVINLHGTLETVATSALEDVKIKRGGADPTQIADQGFQHGLEAFQRQDYQASIKSLEDALSAAPPTWAKRAQAQDYLARNKHRYDQAELLKKGQAAFDGKQYEQARADASSVVAYADGAPDISNNAKQLVTRIDARIQQKALFDDAVKQEYTNTTLAAHEFQKVVDTADGDPEMMGRARSEIAKITAKSPTPSLVPAIQAAIDQGNFGVAEEKLRSLSPSDPNYPVLRQRLDASIFARNSDEAESALQNPRDPVHQATLRRLLDYFQSTAKLSNQYSGIAARYAKDIEAALKALQSTPPTSGGTSGSAVSAEDRDAIHALLVRYADAINRRRPKDLRELWVEIPKSQFEKYQSFLDTHKKVSISFNAEKWEPHGTGVLVTCQELLAYEQDGKLETHPDVITFYVIKMPAGWRVSDIPASSGQ
jgi:eukaryotic-like serine/threonine-protein kinase